MTDIAERLRGWFKDVNAVPAIDLMDEAAAEIERLRTLATNATPTEGSVQGEGTKPVPHQTCPHIRGTVTQHCSLNFTLTDEEREAVESAASAFEYDDDNLECGTIAATLRGLLERL